MKKGLVLLAIAICALLAIGCKGETASQEDKKNIDNLYEKGIGTVMAEEEAKGGGAPKENQPSVASPDGKMVSETQTP